MSTLLDQIKALTDVWHISGSVPDAVLEEFAARAEKKPWKRTMETGCGRTTLLISHYSERHTVFAYGDDDSARKTFGSELLRKDRVELVAGPTQRTVPAYPFDEPFDFVMIDGPHSYPFPELEYYHVYPHIAVGGTLVIDDIWIPTINRLYTFLKEEEMFRLDKVIGRTAFFTRTDAPTFDPLGDDWQAQTYNRLRFPMNQGPLGTLKVMAKRWVKRALFAAGLRKRL